MNTIKGADIQAGMTVRLSERRREIYITEERETPAPDWHCFGGYTSCGAHNLYVHRGEDVELLTDPTPETREQTTSGHYPEDWTDKHGRDMSR